MQATSKNQKIAMVILAAGASTRMQAIKQLLPWKNTTLLGNAIEQGVASKADAVFVVLGANKEKIIPIIKGYTIEIIENKFWSLGLGKSIACAIEFLNNSPIQFDGILIALADQPLLTASHYNEMISKFSNSDIEIVATQQNITIGVPAIFSKKYVEQLSQLNQDKGAKTLLKENLNATYLIDANGRAVDVDTMDSYTTYYSIYGIKK